MMTRTAVYGGIEAFKDELPERFIEAACQQHMVAAGGWR